MSSVFVLPTEEEARKLSVRDQSYPVREDRVPDCDFCTMQGQTPNKAEYDCNTSLGMWGNACKSCFETHGIGLGAGLGQKFIVFASPTRTRLL